MATDLLPPAPEPVLSDPSVQRQVSQQETGRIAMLWGSLPVGAAYKDPDGAFRVKGSATKSWQEDATPTRAEALATANANRAKANRVARKLYDAKTREAALEILRGIHPSEYPMIERMGMEAFAKDKGKKPVFMGVLNSIAKNTYRLAEPLAEAVMGDSAGTEAQKDVLRRLTSSAEALSPDVQQDEPWYKKLTVDVAGMFPYMMAMQNAGQAGKAFTGGMSEAAGLGARATAAAEWAGTAGGMAAGGGPMLFKQSYGEMKDMGLDDKYARPAAAASATVQSVLETIIPEPLRGLSPKLNQGLKQIAWNVTKKMLATVPGEIFEEQTQRLTDEVAKTAATWLDEQVPDMNLGDAFYKAFVEETKQSALPVAVLAGGGSVIGTAAEQQNRYDQYQNTKQFREANQAFAQASSQAAQEFVSNFPGIAQILAEDEQIPSRTRWRELKLPPVGKEQRAKFQNDVRSILGVENASQVRTDQASATEEGNVGDGGQVNSGGEVRQQGTNEEGAVGASEVTPAREVQVAETTPVGEKFEITTPAKQEVQAPPKSQEQQKFEAEATKNVQSVPIWKGATVEFEGRKATVTTKSGHQARVFFDSDTDVDYLEQHARGEQAGKKANALYLAKDGQGYEAGIYLRSGATVETLGHEAIHWAADSNIITAKEVEKYGGEEKMAVAFAKWVGDGRKAPNKIFRKLYQAYRALLNSQDDFFNSIGKRTEAPASSVTSAEEKVAPASAAPPKGPLEASVQQQLDNATDAKEIAYIRTKAASNLATLSEEGNKREYLARNPGPSAEKSLQEKIADAQAAFDRADAALTQAEEKVSPESPTTVETQQAKIGDTRTDELGVKQVYRMVDPNSVGFTESTKDVENHPSVEEYTKLAKEGSVPPPVDIVWNEDSGKPVTSNRRRVMAAQRAGTLVPAWVDEKADAVLFPVETPQASEKPLSEMNMAELRAIATPMGIKGTSKKALAKQIQAARDAEKVDEGLQEFADFARNAPLTESEKASQKLEEEMAAEEATEARAHADIPMYGVYPLKVGGKNKFAVKTSEKGGFGDAIFGTQDEAEQYSTEERRRTEERAESIKKQESAKEEEARKQQKYENSFQGFLSDDPKTRGRQIKTLGKTLVYKGRVVSRKDLIEEKIAAGWSVNERGWLQAPTEEFLDQRDLTKIGIDYARFLSEAISQAPPKTLREKQAAEEQAADKVGQEILGMLKNKGLMVYRGKKKPGLDTEILNKVIEWAGHKIRAKGYQAGAALQEFLEAHGLKGNKKAEANLKPYFDEVERQNAPSEPPPVSEGGETTGTKNVKTAEIREETGMGERTMFELQTDEELDAEADRLLAEDPELGSKTAKQLIKDPTVIKNPKRTEHILGRHIRDLENRFRAGENVQDELRTAVKASELIGTEWHQQGMARQVERASDFSLAGLMRRYNREVGEEASNDMMVQLANLADELEKSKAETEQANEIARQAQIDKQIAEAKLAKRTSPSEKVGTKRARLVKQKNDATSAFKQAWNEAVKAAGGSIATSGGLNPEALAALGKAAKAAAEVVKAYSALNINTFMEFISKVQNDIGSITPDQVKIFKQEWEKERGSEDLPMGDNPSREAVGVRAKQLLRAAVESGITENKEVIKAVHEQLALEGVRQSESDTMDAITDYGKFYPLPPGHTEAEIRRLRGEIRQMRKIQDAQNAIDTAKKLLAQGMSSEDVAKYLQDNKLLPKATGRERATPESIERALIREVNELKKQLPVSQQDDAKQLERRKRSLDRQLAFWEKRKEDAKNGILPGDTKKRKTPEDQEALDKRIAVDKKKREAQEFIAKEMRKRWKAWQWAQATGEEFAAAFTSIVAGLEASFFSRQGVFYLGHPIRTSRALGHAAIAAWSERMAYAYEEDIFNRPNARNGEYKEADIQFTKEDGPVSNLEELTRSNFMRWLANTESKWLLLPRFPAKFGYIPADRAWRTFNNIMRADLYDVQRSHTTGIRQFFHDKLGMKKNQWSEDDIKIAGRTANILSGRGTGLQGSTLSRIVFWAPRWVWSRIQAEFLLPLNMMTPRQLQKWEMDPAMRVAHAELYARAIVAAIAHISLVYFYLWLMADDDDKTVDEPTIELTDLTSTDLFKPSVGGTHVDALGGMQQPLVFMSRVIKAVEATTTDEDAGPYAKDAFDLGMQQVRYKLSVPAGAAMDFLTGKTAVGEELPKELGPRALEILKDRSYPMAYGDMFDALKNLGFKQGAGPAALAFLGDSVNTYGDRVKFKNGTPEEKEEQFQKDLKKMTWNGEPLEYSDLLTATQRRLVEEKYRAKRGQVFYDATHEVKSETDENKQKAKEKMEKNKGFAQQMKDEGVSHIQAQKLFIDFLISRDVKTKFSDTYFEESRRLAELYGADWAKSQAAITAYRVEQLLKAQQ